MPAKITKITPKQAALTPAFVEKYIQIGLSTQPADFDAATEAALAAYRLCNLNRPQIILRMSSPTSGCPMADCTQPLSAYNRRWSSEADS